MRKKYQRMSVILILVCMLSSLLLSACSSPAVQEQAAEDLRELVWLKRLSDSLLRRINRNYRFVMGFNGTLILLGALGLLAPSASALLHNASTILLSLDCLTELLSNEEDRDL